VAQKPRDAVVNFFLSKFTAASRGPPCDSTALVVINTTLASGPSDCGRDL